MNGILRVQIAEDGIDPERLDTLTGYLRAELLKLDVDDVATEHAVSPSGARAIDSAAIGTLLVNLGTSAKGIATIVAVVRGWLTRGAGVQRTVRLEMDGDVIELSQASSADTDRIVALFVAKHSQGVPKH